MKELAKKFNSGKQKTLKLQDKFQFKCTACGKCCFNNDILINIYDLIRLRNATKLSTNEILGKNFTNFYLGSSSGLPVLTINFQESDDGVTKCPFLTPAINIDEVIKKLKAKAKTSKERKELMEKYKKNPKELHKDLEGVKIDRLLCVVYKHRPMVCRLFPLGRIKILSKDGKVKKESFILQDKIDWCAGWETKHKYTLKSFLDGCEFWHYKEGSDKSYEVFERLISSGFFATTKDNKNSKPGPKFKKDSDIVMFIGNLIYNFDSFNYFSKDKRVIKTISGKASHEDFIYVVEKVKKIVDFFIKSYQQAESKKDFNNIRKFMEKMNEGGEKSDK